MTPSTKCRFSNRASPHRPQKILCTTAPVTNNFSCQTQLAQKRIAPSAHGEFEPIFFCTFHAYDMPSKMHNKIDFCFFRRKETTRTDRTHSRPSPRVVLPTNRAWIANSSKTTLLAAKKSGPPRRVVAPMFASIELGGIKSSTKQTVLHSLQMKRASRNSTTNGNGFLGRYHVLLSGLHPSDAGGSNCSFFECLVSRSIRIASNRSAPRRSSSRQACACVSKHRFPKTLTRGSHFSHVRGSKPKDTNFCFRAATTRSLLAMVSKQGARACCVGI